MKMFESGSDYWTGVGARRYLITAILGALVFFVYKRWKGRRLNLPPGPYCLPFVGYYPYVGEEPFKVFQQLSKKYGNIFSIYLGRTLVVVLGDITIVKEVLSMSTTTDRPPKLFDFIPDAVGFSSVNGREWVEQRRYGVRAMRSLGLGGSQWEATVQDEVDEFINVISEQRGNPMDINKLLVSSLSNNITTPVLGMRLPLGHPTREFLDHCITAFSRFFVLSGVHNYFRWMVDVLVKLGVSRYAKANKDLTAFNSFLKGVIEKWKKSNNGEVNFITGYLEEIKRNEENNLNNTFNEKNMRGTIQALMIGGSDTIRAALDWTFVAMANFPDIQKKVQEELDTVLGGDGRPRWTERTKLPYTMAVILEAMRWRNVTPLNTSRIAMEDIKISGYDIPKGTTILANYWGLHHDPNYWKNPEGFDPYHFLSADGMQVNYKADSYLPFSYGKRSCPGEVVTLVECLHYLSAVLQRFTVLPPEGERPKLEGRFGLTYQPVAQKLRFEPRG